MNEDDIKYLPKSWQEIIAKVAGSTSNTQGTVLAGLLAWECVKKLPTADLRTKAIAIAVNLVMLQNKKP